MKRAYKAAIRNVGINRGDKRKAESLGCPSEPATGEGAFNLYVFLSCTPLYSDEHCPESGKWRSRNA